ncbi:MAG: helix-turn-helix domain-containing protein [Burkholderiaceae bacterium]
MSSVTTLPRPPRQSSTYKQVRALQRGFDVILALNTHGPLSISDLSLRTGINRTTLYRIVSSLDALGYVRRSIIDDTVRLTQNVRRLSEGYDDGEQLARAAASSLIQLLSETGWPSSVATPCSEVMLIQETTHGRAEVFVRETAVGTRSPILTTTMGRTYLSFCDEDERQEILLRIAHLKSPEAQLAKDRSYVSNAIDQVRSAGFGYGSTYHPALGCVAMPIRSQGRVLGGINIVFLTAFVGLRVAIDRFIPQLAKAVTTIEANLEAQREVAG